MRFDIQCTDNFRFLNARNAAILLTQLTTFLLFHTKNGCARITARASGDFIRVTLEAHLTGAGAGSVRERDIVGLCAFFPESAIDLLAVDMTVRACGYLIEYTLTENGAIAVDLYLKAEDQLCDLLDKAVGRGIVKDITAMIMRASAFC